MKSAQPKEVIWISSSLRDLQGFPASVQQVMGFAIFQAQCGSKHLRAKPFKVKVGGGVLEVVEDHDGDTYRVVYTVRFADELYVLHSFHKKSRKGIKTPQHDVELIEARLKMAAQLHAERTKRKGK
jgi:phage-related protein